VRISQLSSDTAVPVATIKYYLREGLLHEGQLTSATQANYDDSHVRRLRLIRALVAGAGLSIAAARDLLAGVDNPPASGHDLLGIAHHALAGPFPAPGGAANGSASDAGAANTSTAHPGPANPGTAAIDDMMTDWGWSTDGCDWVGKAAVAEAIDGVRSAGFELPDGMLNTYAAAMHTVAVAEIAGVPTESDEAAVRYVVLGTVLVEPLLLALRRLAQQSASHERFGARPLR
jgi:DNA-binding transcriptional MerR regulator